MQPKDKFPLLRTILKTLGLSSEAVDDIVEWIADLLSDKNEQTANQPEYPYAIRDDFLSPAEHSFYLVLKSSVSTWAVICPKVALGDVFYAKAHDPSRYRSYTNKIDRKHVDFLLCDPKTVRPLLGIELDDKSHQRNERQARDEFVDGVFAAASLPLVHLHVRQAYAVTELDTFLREKCGLAQAETVTPSVSTPQTEALAKPVNATQTESVTQPDTTTPNTSPRCPKCGGEMALRIAKSGSHQGNQFWGCLDYPRCRGIRNYEAPKA